ncbi:hypothetical protein BC835DRAFT_1368396 [Cytidiella melzeri]|nr:hypothetical protein BC835DRAFT_1368396 [Cytidiella melzeri]
MAGFRLHEDVVTPLNNLATGGMWASIDIVVLDLAGVITILGFIWRVSQCLLSFSRPDDLNVAVDTLLDVKAYLAGEDRPEDIYWDALGRYKKIQLSVAENAKSLKRATWRGCIKSIIMGRRARGAIAKARKEACLLLADVKLSATNAARMQFGANNKPEHMDEKYGSIILPSSSAINA